MPIAKNYEWKIKNYFVFIKITSLLNSLPLGIPGGTIPCRLASLAGQFLAVWHPWRDNSLPFGIPGGIIPHILILLELK
jgi:hypothetical protein